jgi:catechol 2,3-dioxygenase-like lactoylglutathione lyase family enzyme
MDFKHSAVTIVPAVDLDESQAFYERLGFALVSRYEAEGYRILADAKGASVHLTGVDREWVDPSRTAYGIYFYSEDVDALAAEFRQRADPKPWGLREFSIGDPSGTLVRVGWPL